MTTFFPPEESFKFSSSENNFGSMRYPFSSSSFCVSCFCAASRIASSFVGTCSKSVAAFGAVESIVVTLYKYGCFTKCGMAIPSEISGLYKHQLVHMEALTQNLNWVHRGIVSLYLF